MLLLGPLSYPLQLAFLEPEREQLWCCLLIPTAAELRLAIYSFHTWQGKKKRLRSKGEIQLLKLPKSPFHCRAIFSTASPSFETQTTTKHTHTHTRCHANSISLLIFGEKKGFRVRSLYREQLKKQGQQCNSVYKPCAGMLIKSYVCNVHIYDTYSF